MTHDTTHDATDATQSTPTDPADPSPIDRAAMGLSAALILLGIVVLGFVEVITGEPFGAAPLTNEAGEIVAMPAVDPTLRTGLVVAGLLVVALWGCYKLAAPEIQPEPDRSVELPSD